MRRHEARREWQVAVPLVLAGVLAGCSGERRPFRCDGDGDCVRGDVTGSCLPVTGTESHCAFPKEGCEDELAWDATAGELAGVCVELDELGKPDDATGVANACGGQVPLARNPGEPCGNCDSGRWECGGENFLLCKGQWELSVPLASEGWVWASTRTGDYEAELSVDNNLATSWFSAGPGAEEVPGAPTRYIWTGRRQDCIQRIRLVGNGSHANRSFRSGYGFDQVTVQVQDDAGNTVFSESRDWPAQAASLSISTGTGVLGSRILLLLGGHQDPACGGFSELVIDAVRAAR